LHIGASVGKQEIHSISLGYAQGEDDDAEYVEGQFIDQ